MQRLGWTALAEFQHLGNTVSKWVHAATGIRMVVATVPGPLVDLYIPFGTEGQGRDDGCPHTLEHLVFMGSEEYPYKGILDKVANRNLASGTNAWTAGDHTCYTLNTAGADGALALLPVYVDHLLWPTLTDESFATEVHHIDGEGKSSGVVYCEMQGRENSMSSRIERAQCGALWAGTDYVCETGGLMKDLRELTVQTVRKYHQDYYRPDNMCVVMVGGVTALQVAEAMVSTVEKAAAREFPSAGGQRPWSASIPPLAATARQTVLFPSESDVDGWTVQIAWRGPPLTDLYDITRLRILTDYLTATAIAPLRKALIDCDDPAAGLVAAGVYDLKVCEIQYTFRDVRQAKAADVERRVMEALAAARGSVDVELILDTARKRLQKHLLKFESNPPDAYSDPIILDFLFGGRDGADPLSGFVDHRAVYDRILREDRDAERWAELLRRWLLDAPYVCTTGQPSQQESVRLQDADRERDAATAERLGSARLAEIAAEVERCEEANKKPIPEHFETRFAVPSVDGLRFFPCAVYRSDEPEAADKALRARVEGTHGRLGFSVQFSSVQTLFCRFTACADCDRVPRELWPYLELYLEMFFERPVKRPGRELTYDQVVAALNREAVRQGASQGRGRMGAFSAGAFPSLTVIEMMFPAEAYAAGVDWMTDLLYHADFDVDRVRISATKLNDSIPTVCRSGGAMSRAMWRKLRLPPGHIECVLNPVRQAEVLEAAIADPAAAAVKLRELAHALSRPDVIRVHCVADFLSMPPEADVAGPWLAFQAASRAPAAYAARPALTPPPATSGGVAASLMSVESTFLVRSVPLPLRTTDPAAPALWVTVEMLTALEGPMWVDLRGSGLTYGYSMSCDHSDQTLQFRLSKAGRAPAAFWKAKKLVSAVEGCNVNELTGARATWVFYLARRVWTTAAAAQEEFFGHLRGEPPMFYRELIQRVMAVTQEQVVESRRVLLSLFDPATAGGTLAVATSPLLGSSITAELQAFGVQHRDLKEVLGTSAARM